MYIAEIKNGNITTQIHGIQEKLKAGNIVKGINTIDTFSFTMLLDNPGFNEIYDYKTLVSVYNTNKNRYEFLGRVLRSNDLMDDSGLITKEVICESYLGFLCDSQQAYISERNWTVRELLTHIIDTHNSQVESYKNFAIGDITVEDKNDNLYLGIQRENSFDAIQTKLIEKLGGEIQFRAESDGLYIDYLTKIGTTRNTSIKLSENMKSITREQDPSAFITRLIPLGAKIKDAEGNETEERIDITSVNNGLMYIDAAEAINAYGIHCGYVYFDDVTVASNLLNKGIEYLQAANKVQVKYTVSALDLSLLGKAYDDFEVHYYYPLENSLLGIDDKARVIKQNIDIVEEYLSTFELGDQQKTLTDIQLEQKKEISKEIESAVGTAKNELKQEVSNSITEDIDDIRNTVTENHTSVLNDCQNIILSALSSYTDISKYEELKQTLEAQIKLLSDELVIKFTEATKEIESVNGDLQTKYNTITKHFTFTINGLTIGQTESPFKVVMDNDEYTMYVNDIPVIILDPDGNSVIPDLRITKSLSLLGFIIDQDSSGNVNCAPILS